MSILPIIDIPVEKILRIRKFSEKVLNETYDRLHKDKRTRFERIFIGKVGEMAFSIYLESMGITHDTTTMFAIYPGTENVDAFDFVVPSTREKVDVKTAYRDFHSRILVPYGPNGQWDQMPKDFYVGVMIRRIFNQDGTMDFEGKQKPYAVIHGYVPRSSPVWIGPTNFGEGPAMWASLKTMQPIQELVEHLKPMSHL